MVKAASLFPTQLPVSDPRILHVAKYRKKCTT
jgi:hypothetical protein